jgi:hypothetical protein
VVCCRGEYGGLHGRLYVMFTHRKAMRLTHAASWAYERLSPTSIPRFRLYLMPRLRELKKEN